MKNEVVRVVLFAVLPYAAGMWLQWWLIGRRYFRTAVALFATVLSWSALMLFVAAKAHAADVVPEMTPDGYAVLLATFPEGAEKVCVAREDAPGSPPDCRVPGSRPGRVSVAVWVRKLEPGEVVCAYSVKGGATSKLSEDCWVAPPSVPAPKPVEGKQ